MDKLFYTVVCCTSMAGCAEGATGTPVLDEQPGVSLEAGSDVKGVSSETGTDAKECTVGTRECVSKTPRHCDAQGKWVNDSPCSSICAAGVCSGKCAPGDKQCTGKVPQICNANGAWVDSPACSFVCAKGDCTGSCVPGEKQCNGVGAESCGPGGEWQAGPTCPFACKEGDCVGTCKAGDRQCREKVAQTCDEWGNWKDGPTCEAVCSKGTCVGKCTPGTKQCADKIPQTCDANGEWKDGELCPFACADEGCIGKCVPGDKTCHSSVPLVCDYQGEWSGADPCPYACSQGGCVGSCVPGNKQCVGNMSQKCTDAGTWQDDIACEHGCIAGSCVPPCAQGARQCNGNTPQTCEGGTWKDGLPCTGGTPYCEVGQCVALSISGRISAGERFACALTSSGGTKCWGSNEYGNLGDGTEDESHVPVDVVGLTSGVVSVSAGLRQACAVTSSGGAKCWGSDMFGQLGNGDPTSDSAVPVDPAGLTSGIGAISSGGDHVCALTTAGGIKCWGYGAWGQLGDGIAKASHVPVDAVGLTSGAKQVSASGNHTCAVTVGDAVWCWGSNTKGQVGLPDETSQYDAPTAIPTLSSGIAQVALGPDFSCARTLAGGVKCWGSNEYGQLGAGGMDSSDTPVDVPGLATGVTSISAGYCHVCAVMGSTGIKCWGCNRKGQFGNTNMTSSATPVDAFGTLQSIIAVSSGTDTTCVLTSDDHSRCAGWNDFGQLGNSSTLTSSTPQSVSGL